VSAKNACILESALIVLSEGVGIIHNGEIYKIYMIYNIYNVAVRIATSLSGINVDIHWLYCPHAGFNSVQSYLRGTGKACAPTF